MTFQSFCLRHFIPITFVCQLKLCSSLKIDLEQHSKWIRVVKWTYKLLG